jgi:hypothetical protein
LAREPSGWVALTTNGHYDTGTLAEEGVFDLAGVDPFEHWHGRITATGGVAEYEVVLKDGCTQRYSVDLVFD